MCVRISGNEYPCHEDELMNCSSLCYGCMNEMPAGHEKCPLCGYNPGSVSVYPYHLPPGTRLNERYILGRVLGHGGFGITYLAWDLKLLRKTAIKEYYPQNVAARNAGEQRVTAFASEEIQEYYSYGLERFLDEARVLSRLLSHPGIVSFEDFFAANGTAYLVMEYLEGQTFKEYLKQGDRRLSFPHAVQIMNPVIDALSEIHRLGLMHRDVSPDNIYITDDGQVKLLDFGAARYAVGEHSRSLSIILKAGYAPEEQYRSRGKQGPWTDIYATAATLYRAVTGIIPPEALDRLDDDILAPPSMLEPSVPPAGEQVMLKALALKGRNRYQTMDEFRYELQRSLRTSAGVNLARNSLKGSPVEATIPIRKGSRAGSDSSSLDDGQSREQTVKKPELRSFKGGLAVQRSLALIIVIGIVMLPGVYYGQKHLNSPGAAALRSHNLAAEPRSNAGMALPAIDAPAAPAEIPAAEQPVVAVPAPVQYSEAPSASYQSTGNNAAVTESSPANSMPRPNVSSDSAASDNQMPRPSVDASSSNSMPRPDVD